MTGSTGKFVRNDDKEQREWIRGFGKEPPKPWTVFEEGGIDVCARWSSPPCRGRSCICRRQQRKSAQEGKRTVRQFSRHIERIRRVMVIGMYRWLPGAMIQTECA